MNTTADAFERPLPRRLASLLAVLILLLFGNVGLTLMHAMDSWNFILLGGYDFGTLGQIGGYYLARVGSQTPALAFAALFIVKSNFQHPVRTVCFTAFAYHGPMTAIRVALRPWSVAPNFDESIAVLAEVLQLLLLVASIAVLAWLVQWLLSGPFARYFKK
jgi:hypothetical protein